jgi:hypothetical protein
MLKMLVWQVPPFPGGVTELEHAAYISTKSLRGVPRNVLEIKAKRGRRRAEKGRKLINTIIIKETVQPCPMD